MRQGRKESLVAAVTHHPYVTSGVVGLFPQLLELLLGDSPELSTLFSYCLGSRDGPHPSNILFPEKTTASDWPMQWHKGPALLPQLETIPKGHLSSSSLIIGQLFPCPPLFPSFPKVAP